LFILLAFFAVGGTYVFINSDAFMWLIGWAALVMVIFIPISLFLWYTDSTGITNIIVGSWEWLGGVHPEGIVRECTEQQKSSGSWTRLILMLVNLVVMIFGAMVVSITAFGGIGIGLPMTFAGSLYALFDDKDTEIMKKGMGVLAIGLAGVILGGMFIRFEYAFTGFICTV
jgi:hypothetical protein